MLLMTLTPDQAFFPLIFMLSIYLLTLAICKRSIIIGVATGFLVGIAIFISFSLLPVIGVAGAWLSLEAIQGYRNRNVTSIVRPALGAAVGFILLSVILYLAYEYDPISRYQAAFQYHASNKSFEFSPAQLLNNFFLNGIDFTFWSGVPIVMLFVGSCAHTISAIVKGSFKRDDSFLLAFLIAFLGINLLGQTRSEVGRLWLFLLPILSIFSGRQIEHDSDRLSTSVEFAVALQWLTVIFMFIFWDYG
jgi:hypothetical protein